MITSILIGTLFIVSCYLVKYKRENGNLNNLLDYYKYEVDKLDNYLKEYKHEKHQ